MMMQVITQKTAASRAQNTVQKATAVVEMVSVSVRLVCLDQRVICRVLMVLGVLTVSMNVAVTHPTVSAATHGYVALSLHDIPPRATALPPRRQSLVGCFCYKLRYRCNYTP